MARLDNDNKKLAKAILESKGTSYEDWLNEKHKEVIVANVNLLSEALKCKKNTESNNSSINSSNSIKNEQRN